jgi:hypothetical protein
MLSREEKWSLTKGSAPWLAVATVVAVAISLEYARRQGRLSLGGVLRRCEDAYSELEKRLEPLALSASKIVS